MSGLVEFAFGFRACLLLLRDVSSDGGRCSGSKRVEMIRLTYNSGYLPNNSEILALNGGLGYRALNNR